MLSAEWPKTSCIGKRRKRERKKERKEKKRKGRKKKKKNKKRKKKKGKKWWGKQTNQKAKQNSKQKKQKTHGGVSSVLYTLSLLTSSGTCPSIWSSGGGACCADFQVLALGGAAVPLPGAGLSGGCLPREAPGGTAPVVGPLWKPGFSPRSSSGALRLQGLEAPGGAADLLSWGRSVLAVLGPPGLCLSRGRRDPGLCPGALCSGACAVGFALPPRSPLRGATVRAPRSCSGSRRARCSP